MLRPKEVVQLWVDAFNSHDLIIRFQDERDQALNIFLLRILHR